MAMKKKYTPYGMDLKYELQTYKNIGKDYGNAKSASKGMIFNLLRFNRKRKNKKKNTYELCNTYSDWKKHVKEVCQHILNYEDILHWLIGQKHYAEQNLEMIKIILIPIYISFISIYDIFGGGKKSLLFFVLIMLIIVVVSGIILIDAMEKVNFWDDYIKIVDEMKETQKTIEIKNDGKGNGVDRRT